MTLTQCGYYSQIAPLSFPSLSCKYTTLFSFYLVLFWTGSWTAEDAWKESWRKKSTWVKPRSLSQLLRCNRHIKQCNRLISSCPSSTEINETAGQRTEGVCLTTGVEGNAQLMSLLSSYNRNVQVGQSCGGSTCTYVHMSVNTLLTGRLKNSAGASDEQLGLRIRSAVCETGQEER